MLPALEAALAADLDDLKGRDRLRSLPPLDGRTRAHAVLHGKSVVSFSSNDYLGLASDPRLEHAAAAASAKFGFGAVASRLVSGDLPPHRALEDALAAFFQTPSALLFPTGYQANLGVLTALASRDDLIVSDALNHASLIDGCRLSRATVRVYPHGDATAARQLLAAPEAAQARRRFLVTESLFSMDGDLAPLADLAAAARDTSSALIVDEAHAVGVLGPAGRGVAAANDVRPDVLIGTLGKAFGAMGGFVAGSAVLRSTLINRARTLLFTTAAPPSVPAAALAALAIVDSPEGDSLRLRLARNIRQLTAALPRSSHAWTPPAVPSPIVPLVLGPDGAAVSASRNLLGAGFFVQPIRPPTVPEGTARLRLTISAAHTPAEIDALAGALLRSLSPS